MTFEYQDYSAMYMASMMQQHMNIVTNMQRMQAQYAQVYEYCFQQYQAITANNASNVNNGNNGNNPYSAGWVQPLSFENIGGESSSGNTQAGNVGTLSLSKSSAPSKASVFAENTSGVKLKRNDSQYGPEFLARVKEIAQKVNCDYRDLLAVMNSESSVNAKSVNPHSGATGLIQFHPRYFDTNRIYNMTPMQQLDEVEKYLVNAKRGAGWGDKKLSAGELYSLVYLPGRANWSVLATKGENLYESNKLFDKNKDGKITHDELALRIKDCYVSDNSFLA